LITKPAGWHIINIISKNYLNGKLLLHNTHPKTETVKILSFFIYIDIIKDYDFKLFLIKKLQSLTNILFL